MYGLGAAKSLDGEILVWDSQLFVSRIRDSAIITSNSNDAEAALLVYANIAEWEPFEIGLVLSVQGLEDAISKLLTKTNHLEPTAFLIHATVSELSGHIVTKESIGSKDHHSSGYTIDLKNQAIDLLGFYSTKHEGVFTHRGSKSHIHFKISGSDQVGHLDEISFSKPVKILLPK